MPGRPSSVSLVDQVVEPLAGPARRSTRAEIITADVVLLQEKKERSRDAENNGGSAPGDRFIPCRSGMDMDVGHYFITQAGDENADRKKRPPFYYGG